MDTATDAPDGEPQAPMAWIDTLDEDAREFYEERAAILEHDAGLSRSEAEALAHELTRDYQRRRQGGPDHGRDR
jgi:hypothetical protein